MPVCANKQTSIDSVTGPLNSTQLFNYFRQIAKNILLAYFNEHCGRKELPQRDELAGAEGLYLFMSVAI